ncbi:hypothetical protein AAVH_33954, partial [Aphelenchoides avenae]
MNRQSFEIRAFELIRPSDAADPSSCVVNAFGSKMPQIFSGDAALARNNCLVFDYDN